MYKKTLKKHGIIDCNLKNDYQIVIIFSANISDAAAHQMTVQFPTAANVCFCTTWENRTSYNR